MRLLAFAVSLLVVLGIALTWFKPHRRVAPAPAVAAASVASAVATAPPADDGSEPDEAALRRIVIAEYEEIERRGGMPLVMTATGKQMVVHPKVHSVRKDTCRRLPASTPEWQWECGVSLMLALHDGDEPLPQGERVYVKRGPDGRWIGG